jgi:SAM-dependent methyltransferase
MDRTYWDSKAENYGEEIFSSIAEDKNGLIKKYIGKYASKKHRAADLGCGAGLYLPLLSKKFKSVYACDLSPELIKKAKKRCAACGNITFETVDMVRQKPGLHGVKFAVSANVLIVPDARIREAIIGNIYRALPKGARLLLVVPSLESVLYVNARLLEWNLKDGMSVKKAMDAGLKSEHRKTGSIGDGLINIDGVTHKHYLREELEVFLKNAGFKPEIIEKTEYKWDTEFDRPPKWMKAPYPWDWMAIVRK